ncbi:MAG: hypothetical protein JRG96_08665 [Deltaproteobacteria bacterium]|nr:hypothetical protein [Deltaproteobacteria bacterium]MBW2421089.1 hypothetical protein [Deltaproteobacteria bacterium]
MSSASRPTKQPAETAEAEEGVRAFHQIDAGTGREQSGYTLRGAGDGQYLLEVSGLASGDWLPSLCERLFAEQINILRGHGRREDDGSVAGAFVLDPTSVRTQVFDIEFMACLQGRKPPGTPYSISVSNYAVNPSTRFGSSIRLDLEGLDRPGFLRTFLQHLEPLELEARKVQISTVNRAVRDRFWLTATEGSDLPGKINDLMELLESLMECYWAR